MVNSVTILYIAILISTYQSPIETLTSTLVLIIHDFTQYAIISSHRNEAVVWRTLQNRMLLSATAGVQLLLANSFLAHSVFFMPLIRGLQEVSAEWPGHGIQLEQPASLVVRSLRKIYQHGWLQGAEIVVGLLSVVPGSVVQTGAYWLSAITYGNMSIRRGFHGSRVETVCLHDVMVNALVCGVALLTGQRMVRMVEKLVWKKLFGGVVDMYREEFDVYSGRRSGLAEVVVSVFICVFDVLTTVCCQTVMALGVAKREVFGRRCETRRAVVKIWLLEMMFGVVRVGMVADWGRLFENVACVGVAAGAVAVVGGYAWEKYVRLRGVEDRRERALRG